MDKESLFNYWTSNVISSAKVTPIEDGGVVNYIWRVTTPTGSSSIVKHASHHLRVNEKFLVSVDRMDYEAQALRTVPGLLSSADHDHIHIQLPEVLRYD